jgi:5'-deoxynucleotidase YfbR-like HD superfamily hydrolase
VVRPHAAEALRTVEPIPAEEVERDVRVLLWSSDLALVRRFHRQPFWRVDGARATLATWVEGGIPLENVAEHSWKVADACLLLAPRFSELELDRVALLAVLHDKMERLTGDQSPIDRTGTGETTHAFGQEPAAAKKRFELEAVARYGAMLSPSAWRVQRSLLKEVLARASAEARFVYAVDKLQALTFMHLKRRRQLHPIDWAFTVRYSRKAVDVYPELAPYFELLLGMLGSKQRMRWYTLRTWLRPRGLATVKPDLQSIGARRGWLARSPARRRP